MNAPALLLGLLLAASLTQAAPPLPRAHAHNDYLHPRPLHDALAYGFCSVEADVYLVDGHLLVAHDRDKVHPQRTLRGLYLAPLAKSVRENGGKIFARAPFTLLIDFKSEADSTFAALREELKSFTNMLTRFTATAVHTNAVTIVLSGNRPVRAVAAEPERYVAIDGRLPDLETDPPVTLIPLVSDNWTKHFQWRGQGPLPAAEKKVLERFVALAHAQGRRIRFWAVPDHEAAWAELYGAGVDLINTDDLPGLAQFLRGRQN